jgi:hypothetical protein
LTERGWRLEFPGYFQGFGVPTQGRERIAGHETEGRGGQDRIESGAFLGPRPAPQPAPDLSPEAHPHPHPSRTFRNGAGEGSALDGDWHGSGR